MSSGFGTFLHQLLIYSFLCASCAHRVGTAEWLRCQDCPLGCHYWRHDQNLQSLPTLLLASRISVHQTYL